MEILLCRIRWLVALTVAIALAAPSVASAALDPDPASYDWGSIDRYQQSPQQNFTFKNTGPDPLIVGTSVSGPDAAQFQLTNNGCSGAFLNVGDGCSVSVFVNPQTTGTLSASLDVDGFSEQASVPLTATATTGTLAVNPNPIAFDPQPWFFGSQNLNVNVQAQSFGVAISGVQITGPDQGLFSINYGNCTGIQLNTFGGCSVGIGFNPTGPTGPAAASLELTSDGQGSPQSIPITADSLSGPAPQLSPATNDFGPVPVGSSSPAQTFTMTNAGDYPAQVQQVLVVSGTPQSFPVTNDDCTLQVVMPTESCTFEISFSPANSGSKEASIFLIGNGPSPVTQVGLSGQGLSPPNAGAVVEGDPAVGERLDCSPVGTNGELSFEWMRDVDPIAAADGPSYEPTSADIGGRISCEITATNPLGSANATSPETAPVAARDLSGEPHSLVAESTCRVVDVDPIAKVDVAGTDPATPESPLTFRSSSKAIDVQLGSLEKTGKRVRFNPRQLADYEDGPVPLTVDGNAITAVLAPCILSGRVSGSKKVRATYAISGANGLHSGVIKTPKLSIKPKGRFTADVTISSYASPDLRFPIGEGTTKYNGVSVELSHHAVRLRSLPDETNTVQIDFVRGVIAGKGGTAKASANLAAGAKAAASFKAAWR